MLQVGCHNPNRLLVIMSWSPGPFGIRHPVIHRQSSSCQHSPALPTASSTFRLILVRGWAADCRTNSEGSLQQADDANSRGHDLKHVLGVAPTYNLAEPFGLAVDFLLWTVHSHPSQIWTILCGLPKSRVNEYIQRPLENTEAGKGIWPSPILSVRESAEKYIQHSYSLSLISLALVRCTEMYNQHCHVDRTKNLKVWKKNKGLTKKKNGVGSLKHPSP